jgi:hypothetical protein
MNEKSGNLELLEPTSSEALIPDSWVEPWMIVAATILLVLLMALAVWILKRKKSITTSPLAVRQAALAEASAALDEIGPVAAREAAVRCSLILRKYLSVVAREPALFETHEEYISRHEALKDFSDDARGTATLGFSRLAAIKYAPQTPDLKTEQVITGSRVLLETLHHGFRA